MVETGLDTKRVRKTDDADTELEALRSCSRALAKLDDPARSRVLLYLARRYEPPPRLITVTPLELEPESRQTVVREYAAAMAAAEPSE